MSVNKVIALICRSVLSVLSSLVPALTIIIEVMEKCLIPQVCADRKPAGYYYVLQGAIEDLMGEENCVQGVS